MTPIVFDYDALHDELAKLEGKNPVVVGIDFATTEDMLDDPVFQTAQSMTWLSYKDIAEIYRRNNESSQLQANAVAYLRQQNIAAHNWAVFEWPDSGDCHE